MTAKATHLSNFCPHCHHEYAHLTQAPDVCVICFKVINDTPLSTVFACPDFLAFQMQTLGLHASELAKGLPQGEAGQGAVDSNVVHEKIFKTRINHELYTFVTTISYQTMLAATWDLDVIMKHIDHNRNITPQELMNICDKVEALGKYAAHLKETFKLGKGSLYDYRKQASEASELGERARGASDSL